MALLLLCLLSLAFALPGLYVAPLPTDQRSPCPGLNAMANHGELPHDGYFCREGLMAATIRVFNMCPSMANVFFQSGLTVPSALGPGAYPFPEKSRIFSLEAFNTIKGGNLDASVSRPDRIEGDPVAFNLSRWNLALNFSVGGKMPLSSILLAHNAAIARTNALNNRTTTPARLHEVGIIQMLFLWLIFDEKPIDNADLTSFMDGRFPASWVLPKQWCVRELAEYFYQILSPAPIPNPPDIILYNVCKSMVNPGIDFPFCEEEFPLAYPPVDPLDWNGKVYTPPALNDPFDSIWPLATQFPSKESDVNCALNDTALLALRQKTLQGYYIALQSGNYDTLVARGAPLFFPSEETGIHQAAAGNYYGIDHLLEYLTLVIPSMNGGFVWFSPSVIDPASVQYWPANSTLKLSQSHNVAFDCYQFPTPADPDGKCRTPVLPGRGGAMFVFESCGPRIKSYLTNFNIFTNEAAVRASSIWDTCWKTMAYCNGTNAVYDSFEDCIEYMTQIPVVSCRTSVLRGNTSVCRGLHAFLASYRPATHCPHISRESETCRDSDCDDVICAGEVPRDDFRWSPIEPHSCPPPSPPVCAAAGSLQASFLFMIVLSLFTRFL